jgi:hypothetical protein
VLDHMNMYLVSHMDEVLKIAMAGPMPAAISPEVAVADVEVETDDTITH